MNINFFRKKTKDKIISIPAWKTDLWFIKLPLYAKYFPQTSQRCDFLPNIWDYQIMKNKQTKSETENE